MEPAAQSRIENDVGGGVVYVGWAPPRSDVARECVENALPWRADAHALLDVNAQRPELHVVDRHGRARLFNLMRESHQAGRPLPIQWSGPTLVDVMERYEIHVVPAFATA